jgi:hypothetical protein
MQSLKVFFIDSWIISVYADGIVHVSELIDNHLVSMGMVSFKGIYSTITTCIYTNDSLILFGLDQKSRVDLSWKFHSVSPFFSCESKGTLLKP